MRISQWDGSVWETIGYYDDAIDGDDEVAWSHEDQKYFLQLFIVSSFSVLFIILY